jgi:hypothetical protein
MSIQARTCYSQQVTFFPVLQPINDQPAQTREMADLESPSFPILRPLHSHLLLVIITAVTMPMMIKT